MLSSKSTDFKRLHLSSSKSCGKFDLSKVSTQVSASKWSISEFAILFKTVGTLVTVKCCLLCIQNTFIWKLWFQYFICLQIVSNSLSKGHILGRFNTEGLKARWKPGNFGSLKNSEAATSNLTHEAEKAKSFNLNIADLATHPVLTMTHVSVLRLLKNMIKT